MATVEVQEDERRDKACLDESVENVQPIVKGVQKSKFLYPRKRRAVGLRSTLRSSERRDDLALRAPDPNNKLLVHPPKRIKEKSINSIVYGTFGSQAKEPESNKGKSKVNTGVTTQNQTSDDAVVSQGNVLSRLRNRSRKCGSQDKEKKSSFREDIKGNGIINSSSPNGNKKK